MRRAAARLCGLFGVLALGLTVIVAQGCGALRPVDDALANLRFSLLRRPASAAIAVVEIDPASLRAAGSWPWDRERFSRAIGNLQAAGATEVAFDVDFSTRASEVADRGLQSAIGRRPGSVILPTFVQDTSRTAADRLLENVPLAAFARDAVLASVNVPIDSDGRVRRYFYGFEGQNGYRPSMGSALSGSPPGRTGSFLIDYGIRLDPIPQLSFDDVYRGRFDPQLVRGRQVLIGATAQELGDHFATPRQPTLSGVYVHALAFESLRLGRALKPLNPWIPAAIAFAAILWLRPRPALSYRRLAVRHAAVLAGALVAPLALQAAAPVAADAGVVLLGQLLCMTWAVRAELRLRADAIVREREAGLLHLALHEPETELPNRRALVQDLAARLAARPGQPAAVVALGIDRFASLRGAIGYQRFSELVRQVAARTGEAAGEPLVAHLSTSVLGVALVEEDPAALARRIAQLEALEPWLFIDGLAVDAFVRGGVAYLHDEPDSTAEGLLENATVALDRARETGRRLVTFNRAAFPDPSLKIALMGDMVRGISSGQLSLHYQPKVSISSGQTTSLEALVRWTHPVRGAISPEILVGTAEETGMIRALTEWTIVQAVADARMLRAAGRDLCIAVNISGSLIADQEFRRHLLRTAAGLEDHLCLEITESAVIDNPKLATAAIAAYRDAGFKISIDDYGSGLSSLSYLKMIDANELKIDRSLVSCLANSARDRLIFRSTVDLAHSLGMTVVAEGVETADVLAILNLMGCDMVQGWIFAKAMPLARLLEFLEGAPREKHADPTETGKRLQRRPPTPATQH